MFAVIGGTEVNEQERRAGEQERASAALRRPRYGSVRPMNARNLCAMGFRLHVIRYSEYITEIIHHATYPQYGFVLEEIHIVCAAI